MKISFTFLISIFFLTSIFAQDVKDAETKMTEFASKTGVIIKFEDYNLPDLKLTYGLAENKIRKLKSGNVEKYFFQISKKGKYGEKTASIAYEDLIETQKALISLKNQAIADSSTTSDYIENKFVTDDGFRVGYYVSKGKLNWYMVLEKYGSDNTIFIKNVSDIEQALNSAKQKMDKLK